MQKDDLKATNLVKEAYLRLKSPIGDPVLCTACVKVAHPMPKLSNKQFTRSIFSKIPDLVHRPTVVLVAGQNCR